jgi:3,4-dihydroxy 2-butanone 4-phosphate synthase/GTP cyclohydrolase II
VERDWSDAISSVEEIIEEARNGRMFILVDHEDRENEGDLVIPAQWATPDAINFMATHGRGLICLSMTGERIDQLGLPLMATNNSSRHETAFTTSIEAREGVTTGISAADRARTVQTAIDASKGAPISRRRGMSFRCARAMAACWCARAIPRRRSISRLAGLNPSGVICEIMNEDGTMARLPDLVAFAQRHGLKIGTISDLISYRRRHDNLVKVRAGEEIDLEFGGDLDDADLHRRDPGRGAYRADQGRHLGRRIRCWCGCMRWTRLLDVWARGPRAARPEFWRAMRIIAEEGRGVLVLLREP